jgi:hypothetical protein
MPAGRPTEYDPAKLRQITMLAELGATDVEVAEFLEVDERTIYRWKLNFPEFCQALKLGKDAADDRVEKSLYRRALGYSHDAVKIVADAKTGESLSVPYTEHYPPDTTACIFWLKNRRREQWRDKLDHELTGKDGGAIETKDVSDLDLCRRWLLLLRKAEIEAEALAANPSKNSQEPSE